MHNRLRVEKNKCLFDNKSDTRSVLLPCHLVLLNVNVLSYSLSVNVVYYFG